MKITGDATAHVRVLYAPNAAVRLEGSGKVRGSLIGKTVHMSGGTFVEWKEIPDSQEGSQTSKAGEDYQARPVEVTPRLVHRWDGFSGRWHKLSSCTFSR